MRFSLSLLLISCVIAFVCAFQAPRLVLSSNRVRSLSSLSYQNDENGDQPPVLVEMSNEQIETTSMVTAAVVGLVYMKSLLWSGLFSLLVHYLSTKDNNWGSAIRLIFGSSVIQAYNAVVALDHSLDVTGQIGSAFTKTWTSLERENEGVQQIHRSWDDAVNTVVVANEKNDLVGKAKDVIKVTLDVSDSAFQAIENAAAMVVAPKTQ